MKKVLLDCGVEPEEFDEDMLTYAVNLVKNKIKELQS